MNIYFLTDSGGVPRYVGITKQLIVVRLKRHLSGARKGTDKDKKADWIRSVLDRGDTVRAVWIEETDDPKREHFFIKLFRDLGFDLTNSSDGGHEGLSEEVREKISRKTKGYRHTKEARAKIVAAQTGRKKFQPKGWKKKHKLTDEQRAHIAEGVRRAKENGRGPWGKPKSKETREKMSKSIKIALAKRKEALERK